MGDIRTVRISKPAKKALGRAPDNVRKKMRAWVDMVETDGMAHTRKVPGFHDEPLSGNRRGQRSIRLSKSYRAFYVVTADGDVKIADVLEVNKHEY